MCVCVLDCGGRKCGSNPQSKERVRLTIPLPPHHSVEQTYTQWRNPSNFLFEIRKDRWKCWRHFSISIFCTEIVCYRSPWMHIYSISSSSSYIYIYTISSYCVCVRGRAPKKLLKKRVPARARRACVCVENALCACVWRRVTIPVCFSATLFSHSDTMAALFILGFRSLLSSRPRLHFSCLCARACVRKGPEPSNGRRRKPVDARTNADSKTIPNDLKKKGKSSIGFFRDPLTKPDIHQTATMTGRFCSRFCTHFPYWY